MNLGDSASDTSSDEVGPDGSDGSIGGDDSLPDLPEYQSSVLSANADDKVLIGADMGGFDITSITSITSTATPLKKQQYQKQ